MKEVFSLVLPFKHEPLTDFNQPENVQAFQAALEKVRAELGKEYPLVINGERIFTEDKLVSVNPANKEQVVGKVSKASKELVDKAFEGANEAFRSWRKMAPEARANVLFKAAAIARRRKHELSAWLVFDAGKPWSQADGDTAEGIDFLEYYGRQMLELAKGQEMEQRENEHNTYFYQPMEAGGDHSAVEFCFRHCLRHDGCPACCREPGSAEAFGKHACYCIQTR